MSNYAEMSPVAPRRIPFRLRLVVLAALPLFLAGIASTARGQSALKINEVNPPGATATFATAVNKTNVVTGDYQLGSSVTKGFEWLGGSNYKTLVFPGSVNFTRANGINDSGEIVGDFLGSDNAYHGFTYIGTTYKQFDLPGGKGNFSTSLFGINNSRNLVGAAGGGTLGPNNEGFVVLSGVVSTFYGSGSDNTYALGINNSNVAVGYYLDSSALAHGFMWAAGAVTQITFPGAVQTGCLGITDAGIITGFYVDASGIEHGFTDNAGVFTSSDLTEVYGMNATGSIVGFYVDPNGVIDGYFASPVTFKPVTVVVPKALSTGIYAINNTDVMSGQFTDASGINHGMILSGSKVTKIDVPGATAGTTFCEGINSTSQVVCNYQDSSGLYHAVKYAAGKFTKIPVAGSTQVVAYGINDAGDLSGYFVDVAGNTHGFLLKGGVGGVLTQLDVPGSVVTFGWGLNSSDTVTLQWVSATSQLQSATYDATTGLYTTNNLPGAFDAGVHQINTTGDLVYAWSDLAGAIHGGAYIGGDYYIYDVNPTLGNTTRGDGINDADLIVGRFQQAANANNSDGFKGAK